jgi:hypothetical protein
MVTLTERVQELDVNVCNMHQVVEYHDTWIRKAGEDIVKWVARRRWWYLLGGGGHGGTS